MLTLAFIQGFVSPLHVIILMILVVAALGIPLGIIWLAKQSSSSPGTHIPPISPEDAALNRRRKELELDRMAIENEERRRNLNK